MIHYKKSANPVLEQRGEEKPLESGDNVTHSTIQRTAKWKTKAEKGSGVKLERSPGKRPPEDCVPCLREHGLPPAQWESMREALSSNTRIKWIWMIILLAS